MLTHFDHNRRTASVAIATMALCVACRHDRSEPAMSATDPCADITTGIDLGQLHRGMGMHGMGMSGGSMPVRSSELDAWLVGARLSGTPTAPRPAVDAALLARGADLYAARCAICHGTNGDGDGRMKVTPPARDFTAGVYELRTTPHEELPTDEDLFRTISRGVHGTSMIPWVTLEERDRWALVAHLKTLSPDFADEPAPTPIAIPTPPAATPAILARGKLLFESAGCAGCHGADGKGNGPAAAVLKDSAGRPVRPRDLTSARYGRGSDVIDIFITLRTGLDGTPMGSFANVLSDDDAWALAHHVHALAPRYVATAGGIACPATASVDPAELQGVEIATMPMMHAGSMMGRSMMGGR